MVRNLRYALLAPIIAVAMAVPAAVPALIHGSTPSHHSDQSNLGPGPSAPTPVPVPQPSSSPSPSHSAAPKGQGKASGGSEHSRDGGGTLAPLGSSHRADGTPSSPKAQASPKPVSTPDATATPQPTQTPQPPAVPLAQSAAGKIALGYAVWDPTYPVSGNQFQNYEGAVGKTPDFVEFYQDPWSCDGQSGEPLYWSNEEQLLTSHDLTPVISWGTNSIPLTYILSGGCNSYIDQSAALAKSWPGTVYIRLDWEMNGSWSAWNPGTQGVSDSTFVEFWQYVVNRFRADGVTNVKWVWSPNIDQGSRPFAAYYPGSGYVNMVGLDGYNYAWSQGAGWQTFAQLFQPSYNEMETVAPGLPMMLCEVSSVEANAAEAADGLSKAQWMAQMADYIPTNMPRVSAVSWFDQPTGGVNYAVNSSASSLAAWDTYFVGAADYEGRLP